jgi:hypothetical protein
MDSLWTLTPHSITCTIANIHHPQFVIDLSIKHFVMQNANFFFRIVLESDHKIALSAKFLFGSILDEQI